MSMREFRRQGMILVLAAVILNVGWATFGFDQAELPADLILVSLAGNLFFMLALFRLRMGPRPATTPLSTDSDPEPVPGSIRDTSPLSRTVDDFPEPILILEDQRPFYVNRAFLTLLELAPADLDESNFVFSRVLTLLRHAMEEGPSARREVEAFRTVTAGAKPVYLTGTLFPLGVGSPLTACVLRNVTERLDDRQRHKEMELEMMRQASMSSLGRMALRMADHVAEPLRTILGSAERGAQGAPAGSEYQTIYEEARRISRILSDLSDRGRRDGSREAETIDLCGLVRSELRLLAAHHPDAGGVRIETELDDELPRLQGLYSDFSLTIEAILANAIEATAGADDRFVHVSARATDTDVLVEISDNGQGIEKREMSRIFDPFVSTKPAAGDLKGDSHRAGLGLTTARYLLERYNARIEVHSTPGRGSTFRVRVPHAAKRPAPEPRPTASAETNLSGVYVY